MGVSEDAINDFLSQWTTNTQGNLVWRILGAVLLLLISHWLIQFVSRRFDRLLKRMDIDDTLYLFLSRLFRYSLYALLIIILLSILGVPTASIIAVLGASVLAIGLALQDSLKNIASSILIIILKPYVVGDFVEINDRTGRVQEVGLYHSRIRTPDNKMLYIPNSEVMSQNIINYSRLKIIRIDMVFGIGYDDDVRKAKQILEEILKNDERILDEPEPVVAVKELGDNSVNFAVQPYANLDDAVNLRYDVTEQVKLRFDEAGISIPFPQRDIHIINTTTSENGNA
jgi:small conductance mechanosensitive channel